jgi:hypothetical protein
MGRIDPQPAPPIGEKFGLATASLCATFCARTAVLDADLCGKKRPGSTPGVLQLTD